MVTHLSELLDSDLALIELNVPFAETRSPVLNACGLEIWNHHGFWNGDYVFLRILS